MEKELYMIKRKSNKQNKYKKIFILFVITLIIEIFVCNFPAFRTLMLGNNDLKVTYAHNGNKIIIPNVGVRVTSVNIEYENELTDMIIYDLSFISEESKNIRELNSKSILINDKHYIEFDTHSKCEKIEIELYTSSNTNIKNVIINHPNFNINIYRIIIIYIIGIIILKLGSENLHNELYDSKSIDQYYNFIYLLIVICAILGIYTIVQKNDNKLFLTPNDIAKDDAILIQTEAFMNGSIPLKVEVPEELINLKDPYNYSLKVEKDIMFLIDMAFYNGKYYSYYGLSPILTLVLPFRVLTGGYLHNYLFNLVYIFGIIFLLFDVYKKLVDRYIKKISLANFYLGYLAILFGSNFLLTLRGLKYDIVTTAGIMFVLLSISLAIRLGNKTKNKILNLIGLGISMSMIVLSKPTYIFSFPLIVYFVWKSISSSKNKEKIKSIILIGVPLVIFGSLQMIYNYVRFDNIFEFGAKYQLTSCNMQYCMNFSLGKIITGFLEHIFKLPKFDFMKFPFVFMEENVMGFVMNEFCYKSKVLGLISIPILWVYLFKKEILKQEKSDLKIFTNLILGIVFSNMIINISMAGICDSYILDLKFLLCINAIILLLKNVEIKENSKEANKIFVILCVVTIVLMIPISLNSSEEWLRDITNPFSVFLKNIFEFWA